MNGGHRPLGWLVLTLAGLLAAVLVTPAQASTGPRLRVYVGYMDTHTVANSPRHPRPWPFRRPDRFIGSPCPHFGHTTDCWDAAAVRLVDVGDRPIRRVHVAVVIGTHTYQLWGHRHRIVPGRGLVLTETGPQDSENFDGSDSAPNDYNGGKRASCASSGVVPRVKVRVGPRLRVYRDVRQVLNTGGVDAGHCRNGHYVADRRDESHPWVRVFRRPER